MPAGTLEALMKNDLKVVTVFMVVIFVMVGALEIRPYDAVAPSKPPVTPGPGNNQTQDLTTDQVVSRSGYTLEGQSSKENFGLGFKQVTMVQADLKWTDDYSSNDVFKLELSRDGQTLGEDQGSSGDLTVKGTASTDETLSGNFTVTITCISAPGIVGPSPIDRDKGNSWDLTVSATHSQEGSP
jgi:hypothetical protein